ncbi:hypothetical protein HIM_08950 [Hirsutella minnesotensis 3608]|uniref:Uncharacterized protein n=1 Tax=Hirsutella minnesotensis 3608 TaxID=1043627 RepID=A0A0F7ZSM8_9HYPO|nr:hypothetical protein HIM_08950 [Hirsutella minnesotensis 3608]
MAFTPADDYLVTSLQGVSQSARDVNNALANWGGDYLGLLNIVEKSRGIVAAAVAVVLPITRNPPTDDILQARQKAAKSLAEDVNVTLNSGIAAKPKVENLTIPMKPTIAAVLKSAQAGFSALGKVYLEDFPAEQKDANQAIFTGINDDLQKCLDAYQS